MVTYNVESSAAEELELQGAGNATHKTKMLR